MQITKPVFIIGISPRCGTEYLLHLLTMHPGCVPTKHRGEDFILFCGDRYLNFVNRVPAQWHEHWNNNPDDFKRSMEQGILNYLKPDGSDAEYVITQTPHAENAHLILKMFSAGYMIVVLRKGQDLVESITQSFRNKRFEDAVRGYNHGFELLQNVMNDKTLMNSGRVMVIRFEDLIEKHGETVGKLLDFLKLNQSLYNFHDSSGHGIIGSSIYSDGADQAAWDDYTNAPLERSQGWNRWKHYRFNWLAGNASRKLGYKIEYESNGFLYFLYNFLKSVPDFLLRVRRMIMTQTGK